MAATLAILDGAVMAPADAQLPVTDEGFIRGDGAFEVIRLYDGKPYALDAHMTRMGGSAGNLRLPFDEGAVRADIITLIDAAGAPDAALRMIVTRGGRRVGLIEELKPLPDSISLASITYAPTRIMDGIKSLSYGANMLATRLAKEKDADEALLVTPHGRVLEGPTTSFFYSLDGETLHTPPLEDHILDSITRRLVIAVSGATERVTAAEDLASVTEAFMASTLREVHPVHAIDGRDLPAAPGPASALAAEQVRQRITEELAAMPAPASA